MNEKVVAGTEIFQNNNKQQRHSDVRRSDNYFGINENSAVVLYYY